MYLKKYIYIYIYICSTFYVGSYYWWREHPQMVLRIKRHLSPYPRLKSVKNDQQNLEGGLYTCIVHFESHWIDIITEWYQTRRDTPMCFGFSQTSEFFYVLWRHPGVHTALCTYVWPMKNFRVHSRMASYVKSYVYTQRLIHVLPNVNDECCQLTMSSDDLDSDFSNII